MSALNALLDALPNDTMSALNAQLDTLPGGTMSALNAHCQCTTAHIHSIISSGNMIEKDDFFFSALGRFNWMLLYAVFLRDHTTGCVRPTLLRQIDR